MYGATSSEFIPGGRHFKGASRIYLTLASLRGEQFDLSQGGTVSSTAASLSVEFCPTIFQHWSSLFEVSLKACISEFRQLNGYDKRHAVNIPRGHQGDQVLPEHV